MILKSDNFYLFLFFTSVFSSFIFCIGFFPFSNQKESKFDNRKIDELNPKIADRTILMIVDALRLDMVEKEDMPYLHGLLESGEGCFMKLKVDLPTVTKPRITALISGTVSSFLDVARNFGSSQVKFDTFLHQMHKRNDKIIVAGDDTWKLFPHFTRSYLNQDSLFVNDFYEGDSNITKTLALELTQKDWKLMILHYLGLDHIGHVFDPFHELVPQKLKEMDEVVKMIHLKLKDWNKGKSQKSILFLTSDHGMRDAGGHSGNSFHEIHIPLFMIGCNCESNNETFYNQIDFATSFSIINGLPLPKSSIGSVIPEFLFSMEPLKKLDLLKIINQRLLDMITSDDKSAEFYLLNQKAKSFHEIFATDSNNKNAYQQAMKLYTQSSKEISDKLAQDSLEINFFYVILGILMNFLIAFTVIIPTDTLFKDAKINFKNSIPLILCWIFFKIFVLNEIFGLKNDLSSFLIIIVLAILLRATIEILMLKLERHKTHLFDNDILYLLLLGHFFYTISVASSSFIEEEHQIWYYFCNAMFIILTFFEFRGRRSLESFLGVAFQCFPVLLLHVFIRRMNQTGDKWINLQDIGDWLHKKENEEWLHLSILISLAASTVWLIYVHLRSKILLPFIVFAKILLYYHQTRSLITERIDLSITTIFWINLIAMIVVDLAVNVRMHGKKFHFVIVLVLISLLLHQPQNVIMMFALGVTSMMMNHACNRMIKDAHEKVVAKIILHWWIGKLFFFYQGNSNSLSTIDTNAGFVGQSHVNLFVIFIFSTINTFNSQIFSLTLLIQHLKDDSKRLMMEAETVMTLITKWLSLLTIIPTTTFLVIITLLRHHLFIWSVFSPRLLYDFCINLLVLIILIIVKFTIKF